MSRPEPQTKTWPAHLLGPSRWIAAGVAGLAVATLLAIWNPVALGVGLVGAAVSLRLWQLLARVRATANVPLVTLMSLNEVRDGVSPGHAHRVAQVTAALAEASRCGLAERDRMTRAAGLHNIGSLAIAPGLLTSPTSLTAEEEREVARHTVVGAEVLSASIVARELVLIVRHHHERWDGGGYPDGLAGEEIPLGARIVAVADAAVALRSPRPYRAALEIGSTIAALRDGASRQWDPRVVDHLATLIATGHPAVVTALETVGDAGEASLVFDLGAGGSPLTPDPSTLAARLPRSQPQPILLPVPIGSPITAGEREVITYD